MKSWPPCLNCVRVVRGIRGKWITTGVGGSSPEAELARMHPRRDGLCADRDDGERLRRIEKAQRLMHEQGVQALYLDVSSNLFYFTGNRLRPIERLHGAIIPADGEVIYISPVFEEPKTRELMRLVPTCAAGKSTRIRQRWSSTHCVA
jgi:hypothetical protein